MNLYPLRLDRHLADQSGLSMIELLLAMVLGIFVMGGLGTVYISSKQTYALRAQISEMDGNARIALNALREHISHAGYNSSGQRINNYILPTDLVVTDNPCIKNVNSIDLTEDRSGRAGDVIGVSFIADQNFSGSCFGNGENYKGDNDSTECKQPGAATLANSRWYNTFRIQDSGSTVRNSLNKFIPQLVCGTSTSTNRVPIALGIESMQLRYGVDSDGDQQADTYMNATEVAAADRWNDILLVKVALLVRSVEPVFPDEQSNQYQLLDQVITSPKDRYRRTVYTTVIRLPNVSAPLM